MISAIITHLGTPRGSKVTSAICSAATRSRRSWRRRAIRRARAGGKAPGRGQRRNDSQCRPSRRFGSRWLPDPDHPVITVSGNRSCIDSIYPVPAPSGRCCSEFSTSVSGVRADVCEGNASASPASTASHSESLSSRNANAHAGDRDENLRTDVHRGPPGAAPRPRRRRARCRASTASAIGAPIGSK